MQAGNGFGSSPFFFVPPTWCEFVHSYSDTGLPAGDDSKEIYGISYAPRFDHVDLAVCILRFESTRHMAILLEIQNVESCHLIHFGAGWKVSDPSLRLTLSRMAKFGWQ
jgi:hypothetical protein